VPTQIEKKVNLLICNDLFLDSRSSQGNKAYQLNLGAKKIHEPRKLQVDYILAMIMGKRSLPTKQIGGRLPHITTNPLDQYILMNQ
jgi:hypothetical protein